jgi:CRP/FNR family transcriptional regulator, anaerobic regulatory protein
MDDFSAIRNFISRFVSFSEEEWNAHQAFLSKRSIKKGGYLLRAGEVCNYVTFINKGFFRIYHTVGDEERTANFAFDGNYVTDYSSFVSRLPSADNIVAMEDAEVLNLHYDDLQKAYEQYPVWQKFGRKVAEYIILFMADRNRSLLFLTPEQYYIKVMKDRPKVIANVPLKYIASYLGVTPEALSRIRKRMSVKA